MKANMSLGENCVVFPSASETVGVHNDLQRKQRQQQQQQQLERQYQCTWLQYYLLANKNDIIDRQKYDYKLVQSDHDDDNVLKLAGSILTPRQTIQLSNSYSSASQKQQQQQRNSSYWLLASKENPSDEVLLISDSGNKGTINETEPIKVCRDGYLKARHLFVRVLKKGNESHSATTEQYRLLSTPFVILLLILISHQNALPCRGFGYPERFDNIGFINYNSPYQSPMLNAAFWGRQNRNSNGNSRGNFMRQLNGDPMETMPTSMDSFTKDQGGLPSSSISPNLSSWTSMLKGAFNGQHDTLDSHIRSILIPRVSGTEGRIEVCDYISNSLRANNYHVELDEFTDSTPVGEIEFANIIASSNPKACRQLVLACHYDSKKMDGFLGAVDSAVPCAMLLKISETFSKSFRSTGDDEKDSLGLRFIFFDGEEAFHHWGPLDSLYGSRHLAAKWHKQPAPSHCGTNKNELNRIELFVLLDLIGAADTSFVMYNRQLRHHYTALQRYERAYLSKNNGLTAAQIRRESAFKNLHQPLEFVEDDHVPFKQRGVPILCLLAHPFPSVWHTNSDNYTAIDFPRTKRILHVLEEFVANYPNN